jgi:hypothetical protein
VDSIIKIMHQVHLGILTAYAGWLKCCKKATRNSFIFGNWGKSQSSSGSDLRLLRNALKQINPGIAYLTGIVLELDV